MGIGLALVAVSLIVLFASCRLSRNIESLLSILVSLGTGMITSVAILWLARKDRATEMQERYSQVAGTYRRTFIAEPASQHQQTLNDENVGLTITIEHEEENHIHIKAQYWKKGDKVDIVEGRASFNESSRYMATGQLRYTTKDTEDVGTYRIMRFETSPTLLHVFYENVIPRNGASGFEIWERV